MLLQTNSYLVPKERRTEHARLLQRFRQQLARLGCDHFEVYEQTGSHWGGGEPSGRFVQILRFRDRQHWTAVQNAEKQDPQAKQLIQEFCDLINLPYQQQAGMFAATFFTSVIVAAPTRVPAAMPAPQASEHRGAEARDTEGHNPEAADSQAAGHPQDGAPDLIEGELHQASDANGELAPTGSASDAAVLSELDDIAEHLNETQPDDKAINGEAELIDFLNEVDPDSEANRSDKSHPQRID